MIRAAAYARYSSTNQREESIEAQLRNIRTYAKKNNIVIAKEYIDRAVSGKTDVKRTQFKQMIKDSSKRLFEVVLTDKVDRFARNRYDAAINKRKLKENGVQVIYVSQPIMNGPEGIIMEALLEGMAEYYSSNLATETMKGLKENAFACRHCGGKPPLGYDVDPETKKYKINVQEAVIVKTIFGMCRNGFGYSEIIHYLNEKGYKTKYGALFGKNSIHDILRNEKYTGTYIFNRAPRKVNGKYNKRTENAKEEIIKIPGGMPQIIPFNEWEEVQKMMDVKKHRAGRKSKEIYLLSSLLKCGVCGSAMTADTRRMKDRDTIYCYYRCNKNNGKNQCDLPAWSRDDLETIVLDRLEQAFFSGDNLNTFVDEIYDYYKDMANEVNQGVNALKHGLEGINKKINNIVNALADGEILASLKSKLKELEEQKELLETQIKEKELEVEFSLPAKEFIRENIRHISKIKSLDKEDLKTIIKEYVNEIVVSHETIDIDVSVNIAGCGSPYTTIITIKNWSEILQSICSRNG